MTWLVRTRHGNLSLSDPLGFSSLELVENYNTPDTLTLEGDVADLDPVLKPGRGCVVWDDTGLQRFSGLVTRLERRGDHTALVTLHSDLLRLWDRILWPTPTAAWTAQTTSHDVQTGVHETRLLAFISRNAGSAALAARRIPSLRLPTSQGRGVSRTYRGRFQNLGAVVALHAENADLRVTIKQTYEGTTPFLDVGIDDTPDESAWARFGPTPYGTLGLLDESFQYSLETPAATVILSAATGSGAARVLTERTTTREDDWWRRIEHFIDQRGAADAGDITEGLDEAEVDTAAPVEVDAPILPGDLVFGPGGIPVGTKVAVVIDGEPIIDRVRSLTTTLSVDDETVTVTPRVGSSDGLTVTERALLKALRRIRELERAQ